MPCTRVPEGPLRGHRRAGAGLSLCCHLVEDFAAVYYDYTAASVVPNYGDFPYREIFSIRGYIPCAYWCKLSLASIGADVGYSIGR